jgi:hypothetical protein
MDHVPGLDLPAAHRALLQRAADHFRDDKRVMGLVLGGSLAHGVADSYADVDLYIVARDESFDAVFEERGAVALGSLLLSFTIDPIPGGSRDYIVTYPTKYKRPRLALPRQALRGPQATIRSNEGLGILSQGAHSKALRRRRRAPGGNLGKDRA